MTDLTHLNLDPMNNLTYNIKINKSTSGRFDKVSRLLVIAGWSTQDVWIVIPKNIFNTFPYKVSRS